MEKIKDVFFTNNISRIIKGSAISIGITLILLLIFSCVLTYTSIGENTIKPIIITISGISILIGSGISTFRLKKNGILNGGAVGIIYMLTIYIISSILYTGFGFNIYSILMIITSLVCGIVGGIIGVNLN